MAVVNNQRVYFVNDKITGLPKSGVNFKITKDGGTFLPSGAGVNSDANGIATIIVTSTGTYDTWVDGSLSTDYQKETIINLNDDQIQGADVNGLGLDLSETSGDFGSKTIQANGSGGISSNVAIGENTLSSNTSGNNNIGIGEPALSSNTTGSFNTAVGVNSLSSNGSGDGNVSIGLNSLLNNTSGNNNVAVGSDSMRFLTSGADNVSQDNCSGLGKGTRVSGDNQVQLGDSSTTTYVYGTVQNRSDKRDKAEIVDSDLGLSFINKLRPVSYKWDMRDDYLIPSTKKVNGKKIDYLKKIEKDGSKIRSRNHYGLIAQEVKEILDENGDDFGGFQDHSISGGQQVMTLGYDEFIAPLISAVQELSDRLKIIEGN
jgi:hypothetical protein